MGRAITAIVSRPVRVAIGGTIYWAGEVTLNDVADLQWWLDDQWGDPLDGLLARLVELEPLERYRATVEAYDRAERGPPKWGEPEAMERFQSGPGIVEIYRLALRTHQPELTYPKLIDVALSAGPGEFESLERAFFRLDPLDFLGRLLEMTGGGDDAESDWVRIIAEMATQCACSPREVYTWTLREFIAMRTGGAERLRGRVVRPGEDLGAIVAEQRRKLAEIERNAS
jgi:hypothetical protein